MIWIFSKRCSPVLSRHSFTIMLISHAQLHVVEGNRETGEVGADRDGGNNRENECELSDGRVVSACDT